MMHELKEAFVKKRAEAQGSRERMKTLADRCVQAYNEAEKRKALGRPGIDPRMAAKKKKKPATAEPDAPRQEAVPIVFPTRLTGSKPKSRSTASDLKKTRTTEAEARKRNTLKPLLLPLQEEEEDQESSGCFHIALDS